MFSLARNRNRRTVNSCEPGLATAPAGGVLGFAVFADLEIQGGLVLAAAAPAVGDHFTGIYPVTRAFQQGFIVTIKT